MPSSRRISNISRLPVMPICSVNGPSSGAFRREQVLFDQVVDRDRALVLDVGTGAADRFLIERHRDDAVVANPPLAAAWSWQIEAHPTERAWASRPSALPSVIAAGPSARNWSGPHFRIDVRFMKSSTPSPDENRAERAVGST